MLINTGKQATWSQVRWVYVVVETTGPGPDGEPVEHYNSIELALEDHEIMHDWISCVIGQALRKYGTTFNSQVYFLYEINQPPKPVE